MSVLMGARGRAYIQECIDGCKGEEPIYKSVLLRVKGRGYV